jgi:hypothetical protein
MRLLDYGCLTPPGLPVFEVKASPTCTPVIEAEINKSGDHPGREKTFSPVRFSPVIFFDYF